MQCAGQFKAIAINKRTYYLPIVRFSFLFFLKRPQSFSHSWVWSNRATAISAYEGCICVLFRQHRFRVLKSTLFALYHFRFLCHISPLNRLSVFRSQFAFTQVLYYWASKIIIKFWTKLFQIYGNFSLNIGTLFECIACPVVKCFMWLAEGWFWIKSNACTFYWAKGQ